MSETTDRRLVVVGQGYVGLPLAIRAAEQGYDVVGYDTNTDRVKWLSAGESYVEDVPSASLATAIAAGRYHPTSLAKDCAGFDVAVVSVPTPLADGNPDLHYIEQAGLTLARYVRPGCVVILESTTYPGTTEEHFGPILEEGSGLAAGSDFYLGYSPERIDPGNARWGIAETPKIVSGINSASLEAVQSFFDTLVNTTVPVSGTREAELAKLLENTFRHVNVALVNELAIFAADLGIDIWESIDAASTKPFGFMRFTPGPGVGGHCLPIDPSYLSWRVRHSLGRSFRFVELANDVNQQMPHYVSSRLTLALNRHRQAVNGSNVLLVGLSYKRNTGDARESPALAVVQQLLALGAIISAADPYVVEAHVPPEVRRVELTPQEVALADAVVVLTDHAVFDFSLLSTAKLVLDTRHVVPPSPSVEYL